MVRHADIELLDRVGAAIRRTRQDSGLNLQELARLSGISISALSLIETGKRDPRLSTLDKIARSLNTTVRSFFGDAATERPGNSSAEGYDLSEFE